MNNFLITGGAGFIGSHVVERMLRQFPNARFTILDKMTYAADIRNLDGMLDWQRCNLVVGDLADFALCTRVTKDVDCVLHLAAESHVDNSFGNSLQFTHSNTLGTHSLLEACRINEVPRMIHVSTDEVYGEIAEGAHSEIDLLNPTNPYSASKAGADMMVISYIHSFKMPITIVRGNNIFGTRQFPEKIIPKFTLQALAGEKLTLHGDGKNCRRFLAVEDFAEALVVLIDRGKHGEIYNVGTEHEFKNIDIARMICELTDRSFDEAVSFVRDRPFNDFRYAMDSSKMHALGWAPQKHLIDALPDLVHWYREHRNRYASQLV